MTVTVLSAIEQALTELNVTLPGESLNPNDAQTCLLKLNRIFDNWNAERAGVYAESQQTFTLTPGLQPHTFGPSGVFVAPQRPATLEGASIVLNGSAPNANVPLTLIDFQQWQAVIVPSVTATVPQWLYYNPLWPNASVFLWPVPTTAYGLLLQWRIALAEVTLTDSISLPQGYTDAFILTLAEDIAGIFGREIPQKLAINARAARARIFANNDVTPKLMTVDFGMPTAGGASQGNRADFNYLNGQVV